LITECQDDTERILGSRFRRYEIEQIHATLVGLEIDEHRRQYFLNRNYKTHQLANVAMNFRGLVEYLRNVCRTPIHIQIGGFQVRDYPFTSRGSRPFNRSISIQGGNVVLIGWPRLGLPSAGTTSLQSAAIDDAALYPSILDCIRQGAQRYGVLHSYHRTPVDTDNDFYLRIGTVEKPECVDSGAQVRVHDALRSKLASRSPLLVDVDLSSVFLAFYESEELPMESTMAYPLTDERLDDVFIRKGYCVGIAS
jgi:hypothetical protein